MTFAEEVNTYVGNLIAEWIADAPTEPAQLAEAHLVLGDAVRQLQAVQSDLEARLVAVIHEPLELPGVGTFERRSQAKSHRWDTDRLLGVVIDQADQERIPDDDGVVVAISTAVENILREVAHIDYWRLQALDRHGIDGRKYRSTEWGRKRVKFTPESEKPPEGGNS